MKNESFINANEIIDRDLLQLPMHRLGLNGMRIFNKKHFPQSKAGLEAHYHQDAMEICYVTKGTQIYATENPAQKYRVSRGMVFLTYPNEPHSTAGMPEENGVELYYMIIDTVNELDRFLGFTGADGRSLATRLNSLNRCFYVGMKLKSRLDEMIRLYLEKPPMCSLTLRCHAALMIQELFSTQQKQNSLGSNSALTGDILGILNHIEDTLYGEPLSVQDMADYVYMSVPAFKQKFKQEIGIPPFEYQMKRRVEEACSLLEAGEKVTQVAFELGFSSSQHFSTAFRKRMHTSPREWKNTAR